MGPGGAEKVMALVANGLVDRGHEVTLLTLNSRDDAAFYEIDHQVQQLSLGKNDFNGKRGLFWSIRQSFALWYGLRNYLKASRPNVLLAFINTTNSLALVASVGLHQPVVISERSDPGPTPLHRFWRFARWVSYPFASTIVVQSDEVKEWFSARLQKKIKVIPNPIQKPPECSSLNEIRHNRRVIAVGRLAWEKGFDLLLEAFAQLVDLYPDWSLAIWGEGPLRKDLEIYRDGLGLQGRVVFHGLSRDLHQHYLQASVFVLSSRFEGFPNALCEAMAHGLPVVATSCSGGVRSLLQSEQNGLLVPAEDPEALSGALGRLMGDSALRESFGLKAQTVVENYGLEKITDKWEHCLKLACSST